MLFYAKTILSEESLNKLIKLGLIAMFIGLKQKMDTIQSNISDDVPNSQKQFCLLESGFVVSKNANNLLPERLVSKERHYWANSQCSRRECVEVAGIP